MTTVCISIDNAEEGMVLAEDVFMPNKKMILCKKGTVLTDSMIERLRNIGVESILIEQKLGREEREKMLQEKINAIEKAFLYKDGACVNMIKDSLINFWKKKFLEDE